MEYIGGLVFNAVGLEKQRQNHSTVAKSNSENNYFVSSLLKHML